MGKKICLIALITIYFADFHPHQHPLITHWRRYVVSECLLVICIFMSVLIVKRKHQALDLQNIFDSSNCLFKTSQLDIQFRSEKTPISHLSLGDYRYIFTYNHRDFGN